MVAGLWGRKIGMTQVFKDNKAVPVTAIRTGNWIITAIKNKERDGYDALQIGCLKNKYQDKSFEKQWLKSMRTYFSMIHEVHIFNTVDTLIVGQVLDAASVLSQGDMIDVVGTSKGIGFQGVVKRHDFNGPPG